MNLRFDTLQQAFLDIVQDGVVLDDSQVLGLGLELLVRVLPGASHTAHGHLLRSHLLCHLAGGWEGQLVSKDD